MGDMADFINDDDVDPMYDFRGTITCRHCQKDGLHWEQDDTGKWVLYDEDGDVHNCPTVELV